MRAATILICFCALMASLVFASSTNEVPPMILARNPARVYKTATGFTAQYSSGKSEQWYRTATGYSVGGQHYYSHSSGYSGGKDERYYRTAAGWSAQLGRDRLMIYSNAAGYSAGSNRYYRSASGLSNPTAR